MTSRSPSAADAALRYIFGLLGGVLVSVVVGFAFGASAGWFSFVVLSPILGAVTARYGYGLWRFLGELLSLP